MSPKKTRKTKMKRTVINKLLPLVFSFILIGCQTTAQTVPTVDKELPSKASKVKPNVQVPDLPPGTGDQLVFIHVPTACIKVEAFEKVMKEQYEESPKVFWVHMNTQMKTAVPAVLYHNEKEDTVTVALFLEIIKAATGDRQRRACLISAGGGLKIKQMAVTRGTSIKFLK